MQTYAWTAMGMRESDMGPTLFVKSHEVSHRMSASLEEKLAMVLWYITESDVKRMSVDIAALRSYLDDKEITDWLDDRNRRGLIKNTRFTFNKQAQSQMLEPRFYKR